MRIALAALVFFTLPAVADFREYVDVARDPSLEARLRLAAATTLKAYPQLKPEDLAISIVDVTRPAMLARADHQGDSPFYPASVIKLFFLSDVYSTGNAGIGDMERALREMITVSDNDATAYIVDIQAKTVPGPPLEGRSLRRYIEKRRDINRRFQKLGYANNVSAMMKPWSFGPYGVDLQVLGTNRENRNLLTANATASLLLWIVRLRAPGSAEMMRLLERPLDPPREDENQVKGFIGEAVPAGTKVWSKAGWTSEVRLDAAYLEQPGGRKLILVIFTRGIAEDVTLIPAVTKHVLEELGR